jgi:hypothetical protein
MIDGLAERGSGLELAPEVEGLDTFPKPYAWSARMRTSLLPLTDTDARTIEGKLRPRLRPPRDAAASYGPRPRERAP